MVSPWGSLVTSAPAGSSCRADTTRDERAAREGPLLLEALALAHCLEQGGSASARADVPSASIERPPPAAASRGRVNIGLIVLGALLVYATLYLIAFSSGFDA